MIDPRFRQAHSVPVGIEVSGNSSITRPRRLSTFVEFAPGYRFELTPGRRNDFALPAGRYRVQIWSPYGFWSVNKASIDIDTTSGHPVLFYYAIPHSIYHDGTVGFVPPQRAGSVFSVLLIVGVIAAVALLATVLSLLQ